MLLPEKKEREYRFKLALRMGLPIFGLILVLVFTTLINNYHNLTAAFYIESVLLLFVSVYFILYLIYKGFDVQIADPISKTFTREYLYNYLKEEIKKHEKYTLILISVDNLSDINAQYGIKNGDKVLRYMAAWIGEYMQKQGIDDFPLGRIKGGDFVIGLEGDANEHRVLVELLCLKSDEFKVDTIEVKISGAIADTALSKNLDHLIDSLFDQQELNRYKKEVGFESIDPTELESLVIDALEKGSLSIASQDVFTPNKEVAFSELFIRLKTKNGRYVHQKKYMKVIKKLGLTLDFDIMLIEKIAKNLEHFRRERLAVTVTTSSLRDNLFRSKIEQLCSQYENLRGRLILLFSEHEYYSKTQRFNTIIKSYKELGIELAVDHLGSEHASFLYLRDLDIDIVRFDSSYTKAQKITQCRPILEGFLVMAKKKGVRSWVKMIETKEQFTLMQELGVEYIQGKYLSQMEEEKV